MLYAMLGVGLLMGLLSILFRVAAFFRLGIPLLYALVVPTLFSAWYNSNKMLAEGIFYGLLALVVISWIVTLVRKIREWRGRKQDDKIAEEMFVRRLEQAKAEGRDTVSTEGLFRD